MDNEYQQIIEIIKALSGSGVWSSIFLGALLLKKYVINGNIEKALALKEREIAALSSLDAKLGQVLQYQRECVHRGHDNATFRRDPPAGASLPRECVHGGYDNATHT